MPSSSPYRTFLVLLAFAVPLSALPGEWRNLGPDGGSVYTLAIAPSNPQVMYAGVEGGLYKSLDGGASWTYAGRGLDFAIPVASIAVDPLQASTVYVGQVAGVFKSVNGGQSWVRMGLSGIVGVTAHPRLSGTLFAASADGLFRTGNGGAAWRRLTRGLPANHRPIRVVIDSTTPSRVYAMVDDFDTSQRRLFKSTDGGNSWRPADSGLEGQEILSLTIDLRGPQTLYAGTFEGVYKSTDSGGTWRRTGLEGVTFIKAVKVHPTRRNVVFAGADGGLFRSQNGGATWSPVSAGLPENGVVMSLEFLPFSPETLVAGVVAAPRRGGVFRSADGGTSWRLTSQGLSALSVSSIAVDPSNSNTLWIVANAVVFKSNDRGQTWLRIRLDPSNPLAGLVAIDPLDPSTVYVSLTNRDLWRTRDGGRTWEAIGNPGVSTLELLIDPVNPATLYAAGYGGIAKSTDRGETWTALPGDASGVPYFDLAIPASSPSTLYAAGAHLLRSTDAGATWTRIEQGLSSAAGTPITLEVDPGAPTTVSTVFSGNVYRTLNGGESWSFFSNTFHNRPIKPLAVSPARPGLLYAAVWFDNVYEIQDGANNWEPLGESPGQLATDVLVVDPHDPCRIYLGTRSRGLLAFTKEDCGP